MKDKKPNQDNSFDSIKLKGFKQLEKDDLKDLDPEEFKKIRLDEFKDEQIKDFKEFIDDSKFSRNLEDLKIELNSDNSTKEIIKELESIGIDGKGPLKLLEKIKKGYI